MLPLRLVLKVNAPFPWEVTHCGDAFLNAENCGRGAGGGPRPNRTKISLGKLSKQAKRNNPIFHGCAVPCKLSVGITVLSRAAVVTKIDK